MIHFKRGDWQLHLFKSAQFDDEPTPLLIGLDFNHRKGHRPLTTLKKAFYYNYILVELHLFRRQYALTFGKDYVPVDYEYGLKMFRHESYGEPKP